MSFVLAEGAYTSYAVYDSFDDAEISYADCAVAWVNCLETKATLVLTYGNGYLKVYDIDTKTLGSSTEISFADFMNLQTLGWIFKQTFLHTYIAFLAATTKNLLIYKNGVLLQTFTPAELGLNAYGPYSISFSPRGKYIFLTGVRLTSGNKGWVVLKGT